MESSQLIVVHVVQCADGIAHSDGCVAVFTDPSLATKYAGEREVSDPGVDYWVKPMPILMALPGKVFP